MQCGVSTACLYPKETIASLQALQEQKIHTTEIFLNTFSELEPAYIDALQAQIAAYGTKVVALHPFTSGIESFFFASLYPTRMTDGVQLYRRYFEICSQLAIPRFVFHGDYKQTPFSFRQHCQNYVQLRKIAREEYGVDFCQENVVRCKCGSPQFVSLMRRYTEDDVSFVLDIKQMRRAQVSLDDMLQAMGNKIVHLHLSDATDITDCAMPGSGNFDFFEMFLHLRQNGFSGDMIIELYSGEVKEVQALQVAAAYLDTIYAATAAHG